MASLRALCVGTAAWDELLVLDAFPPAGSLVSARQRSGALGGVGRCALVLKSLGVQVTLRSWLGPGAHGDAVRREVESAGVDADFVAADRDLVSTVLLAGGDRTIVSGAPLPPLPPAPPQPHPFDLVLCATGETEAFLSAAPAPWSSYDGGDRSTPARVAAARAARLVTGRPAFFSGLYHDLAGSHGGFADGARVLLAGRTDVVVVTDGPGPVWVATRAGEFTVSPPEVPALDTTGCGDVFHAALAGCLAHDRPLVESVGFAVELASSHAAELGNARLLARLP